MASKASARVLHGGRERDVCGCVCVCEYNEYNEITLILYAKLYAL